MYFHVHVWLDLYIVYVNFVCAVVAWCEIKSPMANRIFLSSPWWSIQCLWISLSPLTTTIAPTSEYKRVLCTTITLDLVCQWYQLFESKQFLGGPLWPNNIYRQQNWSLMYLNVWSVYMYDEWLGGRSENLVLQLDNRCRDVSYVGTCQLRCACACYEQMWSWLVHVSSRVANFQ